MARDEAKWAYWTKQIEEWQASGLSRNAYCKREGVKPTTFDYWRPLIVANHGDAKMAKQSAGGNEITLVPVVLGQPLTIDPPHATAPPQTIQLKSPSGWEMQLPSNVNTHWLIDVLRQLL